MIACPACSERAPDGSRFCPRCGHALEAGSVDPTRTSLPQAKPAHADSLPLDEGRFLPGTVLAGRYRIYGLLGRGGMGEVYRADDVKLGQSVALKFLPRDVETDQARRSRFLNEVKLARQISHANVCRVYDVGDVEGRHFLTMEYVDGEDLSALLRRIGHLPREKAIQIARQLCAGLAAAHEQGVLHRDLKPANVMIDGRGRAKITDFGLAVLAAVPEGTEHGAGTPAYMAPEQLSGGAASVKSDVYALGLVLYELFTGHRPFSAATPQELARLQQEATPTSPSNHVDGFDPAVERVILRCLRSDPKDRPASALAVAAALPGGDPLAAALAAGETPSPELLAEAGEVGGLSPGVAWSCAAAAVVGFALVLALSGRTQLQRLTRPDKPPEVLTERAETILGELGYGEPPGDTAFGFSADGGYLGYVVEHDRSIHRWERLSKGRPPAIRFWYRQSPAALLPMDRILPYPLEHEPPTTGPGMITVLLDLRGRLERFVSVPPEREDGAVTGGEPDWQPLLKAAGLDPATLKSVDSQWVPGVAADRRAAWDGVCPDAPEIPIHIEAAGYRGRVVSFRIVYPWTTPAGDTESGKSLLLRISAAMVGGMVFTIIVAAVLLARRNVRLGRGDRKGAFRLAMVVFSLGVITTLLSGHYVASTRETGRFLMCTAFPLLVAAAVWIFYLALEPYLRRIWPQMIVSWVRLLDGRVRDPLVARDVLVGLMFGVGQRLIDQGYQLVSERLGIAAQISDTITGPPIDQILFCFSGMRQALSNLSAYFVAALLFPLGLLVLLLLCRIVLRRQWLAISMFLLLGIAAGIPPGADPRGLIVWGAVGGIVILTALFRFGLLTMVVSALVSTLLVSFPMTPDPSSWYFSRTLLVVFVLGAIVAYGIRFSVSGYSGMRAAIPGRES